MNETARTPRSPPGRPDLAWGRVTGPGKSGSLIEDQLAALVLTAVASARFRADVIHIGSQTADGELGCG